MAPLPGGRAVMVGGYTESQGGAQGPVRREVLDTWVYNGPSGWSQVKFTSQVLPPPRLTHQVVSIGERVYILGGWNPAAGGEAQFLDDVWRLDMQSGAWTRVQLSGQALPRISRFQAVALDDRRVLIHHHRCSDHVLVMELGTSPDEATLVQVPVRGDVPPSCGLHSLTLAPSKDRLVLLGGAPQKGPMMGDLYELNLTTWVWARVEPSVPPGTQHPPARCAHTAVALAGGTHVLFSGGAFYKDQENGGGGLEVLDDIFLYDVVHKAWAWAAPAPGASAPRLPTARNAACMVALGGSSDGVSSTTQLLLHGGWVPFQQSFNDTHILTVSV